MNMQRLTTGDLVLEPLVVSHAEAMFEVLRDPKLYQYLDYPPPPSAQHLRKVYAKLETRKSPDEKEHWLNWVVRPKGLAPVGFVQATVVPDKFAWVAYVISSAHWGRGYATEATKTMIEHLVSAYSVTRFQATVEAENERSIRLLKRLGFHAATEQELHEHELSPTELLFVR